MTLVNAVRVRHAGGRVRVVNNPSIALYGRREVSISRSERLTYDEAVEVGVRYLEARTRPDVSWDMEVLPVGQWNHDFKVGDWIKDEDDNELQVVALNGKLDPDNGQLLTRPELVSRRNKRMLDADAEFDRFLRRHGLGSTTAGAAPSVIQLSSEKLTDVFHHTWNWYDPGPTKNPPEPVEILDDDTQWVAHEITEPCRAWLWGVEPDYTHAHSTSVFELHLNGSLWNGFFNITVPASGLPGAATLIWMFGHEFLEIGDRISIRCIKNGGHHQGKAGIRLTQQV